MSTAKLLAQLVRKLWPQARVAHFSEGMTALEHWREEGADLVLLDWGLPGSVSGLDLLRDIRRDSNDVVCVMITGRAAREMILSALHHRVDAYIVKPFRPQEVLARLTEVMKSAQALSRMPKPASPDSLADFVALQLREGAIGMPIAPKLVEALAKLPQADAEQRASLVRRCRVEPALVARLLGIANNSHYNTGATVIETFEGALELVGLDGLTNLAFTLSLQPGSELRDDFLQRRCLLEQRACLDLVAVVNRLGQRIEHDVSACRAACLLYRAGEFTLLQILQAWADLGHSLDETACNAIIQTHAAEAAIQLKMQWQIPTSIRLRAGSTYQLTSGTVKIDDILMRLAALIASGEDSDELKRLFSRLGIADHSIDAFRLPPRSPDT
ncbi:MAG: response regulator [Chromatiaceae bacterium]|nr:response regulator [Chromatiaceae bacterium]